MAPRSRHPGSLLIADTVHAKRVPVLSLLLRVESGRARFATKNHAHPLIEGLPLTCKGLNHRGWRMLRRCCGNLPQRAKPMVANMRGHTLFIAGAMIGALFSSSSANAQAAGPPTNETWFCTEKMASDQARRPLEFLVQNSYLTAQPLGAPRYRVLDNTPYGLVAVDYSADLDIGFVSVYVATVMIDRVSGAFTSTLATSGATPEVHTGQCQIHQAAAGGQTIGATATPKK